MSQEENVLVLPKDAKRVAQLRLKLAEYNQRLDRQAESGDPSRAWGTICKIAVLETLLENGSVQLDAVREAVTQKHSEAVGKLLSAFEVISDYCLTGGKNCSYGTGLPEIEVAPAPEAGISKKHLENICKLGQGSAVCAFLACGADGFTCAKGSSIATIIQQRIKEGSMRAKGDNCSGPPDFTPTTQH